MFMKCVKLPIKLACNYEYSVEYRCRIQSLKARFDSYENQLDFRSSSGHVTTESYIRGHLI